jgi:uncharacterized OsmC-like protein
LRPFLGLSEKVRPGFQSVRVNYRVKADASREQIEELCAYVQKTSPVFDVISKPVPIKVTLER